MNIKYIFKTFLFIFIFTNNVFAGNDSLFHKIISPITDTVDIITQPISKSLNNVIDMTKKGIGFSTCPKNKSIVWDNCSGTKNYRGDLYDGEWRNNCPYGYGKMMYSKHNYGDNVVSYIGDWQACAKHGFGTLYYVEDGEDFVEQNTPLETKDLFYYKLEGVFKNGRAVTTKDIPLKAFFNNGSSITYLYKGTVIVDSRNFLNGDDYIYEGKLENKSFNPVGPGTVKYPDPCWKTHRQLGMKKKNGIMVPNCVPKNKELDEEFSSDASHLVSLEEGTAAAQLSLNHFIAYILISILLAASVVSYTAYLKRHTKTIDIAGKTSVDTQPRSQNNANTSENINYKMLMRDKKTIKDSELDDLDFDL